MSLPARLKGGLFLSTLSLRRATFYLPSIPYNSINFYPRSPCGERQQETAPEEVENYISIHALLAESDLRLMYFWPFGRLFLSTLSLRRATMLDA